MSAGARWPCGPCPRGRRRKKKRFEAELFQGHEDAAVVVPFDPGEVWGGAPGEIGCREHVGRAVRGELAGVPLSRRRPRDGILRGMMPSRTTALLLLPAVLSLGCGAAATSGGASADTPPAPSVGGASATSPGDEPGSAPGGSDEDDAKAAGGEPDKPKEARADEKASPGQAASDSTALTGKLSQKDIQMIVLKSSDLFNDCYTLGAGKGQQFVATVTVKATIGPKGTVNEAKIQKSTAKNQKVDQCVAEAFRKIQFPAPKDGATSVITFPMEFNGAEEVKK